MSDDNYESDYDDESDYEVGYTNVSLGFADEAITNTNELDLTSNHIGSYPVWLHNVRPADKLTHCKSCNKKMKLLAQVYSQITGYYDRVIYVLVCAEVGCRRKQGSIRAIRGIRRDEQLEAQRKDDEQEPEREEQQKSQAKKAEIAKIGESIFGSGGFGSSASSTSASSPAPIATRRETTKVVKEVADEKWPAFKSGYFITVDDEVLTPQKNEIDQSKIEMLPESESLPEPTSTTEAGGVSTSNDELAKAVESAATDKTFQHFCSIVAHNPYQVLRYEMQTLAPLLYNNSDEAAKTLNDNKLLDVKLELQIMPFTILKVEENEELTIQEGMEWGTIFVATSTDDKVLPELDANGVGYIEEYCGVQWEEEQDYRPKNQ